MYILGLIPRNSTDLAEAVPIDDDFMDDVDLSKHALTSPITYIPTVVMSNYTALYGGLFTYYIQLCFQMGGDLL